MSMDNEFGIGFKEDLFYRCKRCDSVLTEADFSFNRELGYDECICGHCQVGYDVYQAYKQNEARKVDNPILPFFAYNIFCYITPYFLYGELVYLFVTGIKNHSFFLFRWLLDGWLGSTIAYAQWIGLGIDIVLMLIGLIAIIYRAKGIAEGDGLLGYESVTETYKMTTFSESFLTGAVKGHSENVTVYDSDNIALNIMIFIWNLIKVIGITLIGVFVIIINFFMLLNARRNRAPKSGPAKERYELAARYEKVIRDNYKACRHFERYSKREWKRKEKDCRFLDAKERTKALAGRYVLKVGDEVYYIVGEIQLKDNFDGSNNRFKIGKSSFVEVNLLSRPNNEKDEFAFILIGYGDYIIPYQKDQFDKYIHKYMKSFTYDMVSHDEEGLKKFIDKK